MRKKAPLILAALGVVAAAALFGGVLRGSDAGGGVTGSDPATAVRLVSGFAPPTNTEAYVAELEGRVAANPRDAQGNMLLGLAYQQRARETGDPSYYPRSEEALERSLSLTPRNYLAVTGLAALAASRHRFAEARRLAARAVRLSPSNAEAYGVLGDALVELGRYRQAFARFDEMVSRKPTLAAYARISYARELLGHPAAAIAAMKRAVEAGAGTAEPAAWALVQLGNLYFDTGRLVPAARSYREALVRFPGYVHAQAGLGRVDAARGRYGAAAERYRGAVAKLPLPQYEAALGDVLRLDGRPEAALRAYAVVDATERLLRANAVRTELETALFDLDHGRSVADALSRAREAYRERKSIEGEDVLAWALYQNGRCGQALAHSRRALRLGTLDALKIFHHGMIQLCLGDEAAGLANLRRALGINPYFSLIYAPVAEKELR
ncbi:MAG TPA: tetratricopeptide repeat protein [Gaiellaceae bacterium]|jgi:tetratricopeptide (TPR) repeat protein